MMYEAQLIFKSPQKYYLKVGVCDGLAGVIEKLEGAPDHGLADLLLALLLERRVLLRLDVEVRDVEDTAADARGDEVEPTEVYLATWKLAK